MNNYLRYISIALFSACCLQASSISSIQSLIKSGDYELAISYIEERLTNNPDDSEASIYKCLADIGYFFENSLPSYLVNNLNAKSSRTSTAFDYDPSISEIEGTLIPLEDSYGTTIGYWVDFQNSAFPLFSSNGDIESQNRFYNIFDWTLERTTGNIFGVENNYFQASKDNSYISFTYSGTPPKQCDFSINNSNGSDSVLEFYLNGVYMGYINGSSFFYEIGETYISGSDQLPLYLKSGDTVTFAAKNNYGSSTDSFIGPGIMPNDFLFGTMAAENGTGYVATYPNLGNSITLKDIFQIITKSDLPVRNLIESIIFNLDNVSIENPVTIPASFSGYSSDILIQNEDAMMLQSMLKILNASLGVLDQYDLSIDYNYETISNLEIYKSAKSFFSDFPDFLKGISERINDQADTEAEILSALTQIETTLPLIWYRSPLTDLSTSYLLSISDDLNNEDYSELNAQIDSLKVSLSGFDNYNNLTQRQYGGFKYSIAPFVSNTPFPLKELITDIENDPHLNEAIYSTFDFDTPRVKQKKQQLLINYGIVRDILPSSLNGNIMIFKNSNGSTEASILINEDFDNWNTLDYSPFTGKIRTNMGEILDNASYENPIQLNYVSEGYGTWELNNAYMGDTSESGEFFYYNGSLDLNNNGIADGAELSGGNAMNDSMSTIIENDTGIEYPNGLDQSTIHNSEVLRRQSAPDSLHEMIIITKEIPTQYEIDMGMNGDYWNYYNEDSFWPYKAISFISKNDFIELNGVMQDGIWNGGMKDEYGRQFRSWTEYEYNNGIISPLWGGDPKILNFSTSYTGIIYEQLKEKQFVCYPSYLDMDNDGLNDGTEILSGIIPYFTDYPTYNDIQSAIISYIDTSDSDNSSDNGTAIIEDNPNALTDSDNDNMPDALEIQFGGNPSNSNDAQVSLDAIISSDRYTMEEISDLRLGSTLFEVSEGLATFNIILEETSDLINWAPYGEYTMELTSDESSPIKFYRFKMGD